MTTELKQASVKLVLDTRAALDAAEAFGREEADARRRGGEQQPGGGGEQGGRAPDAAPPGRGTAPGGGPGGGGGGSSPPGGRGAPGAAWDAGKATWNGGAAGLREHLGGIAKTVPLLGTAVAVTEFAAEYGPMAAAAARRAFGGPLAQVGEGAVVELVRKYNEIASRLAAIDASVAQTKAALIVQAKLWGGEVDGAELGKFAAAAYRVNAQLERVRLARKLAEARATGEAVGQFSEELYKTMVDGTKLAAR